VLYRLSYASEEAIALIALVFPNGQTDPLVWQERAMFLLLPLYGVKRLLELFVYPILL
jgi:hypothetical protein